jgi:hypothetical protein
LANAGSFPSQGLQELGVGVEQEFLGQM